MKYEVMFQRSHLACEIIEANSEEEAEAKAENMLDEAMLDFGDSNDEVLQVEEVE